MTKHDFMQPGRAMSVAENGMAATSHPLATLAAIDVLRRGGNAVDAGVAAIAVLGVVEPQMTGIGGDCFALYAPASGPITAVNGSGRAPAAAALDFFLDRGIREIEGTSPHAVTIPGAVAAWDKLVSTYGRLSLKEVLAPAISIADDGFRLTPRTQLDWDRYRDRVAGNDDAARMFLPGGSVPAIGERFRNPALANTLRQIAEHGAKAFYEGDVAAEIVSVLRERGGLHGLEDFAACETTETQPISATYRDHTLVECPPNGQGLAALLIARILDGFDLSDPKLDEADRIHLFAEASKAAYAQRDALIADPTAMSARPEDVLDERFVSRLRAQISTAKASRSESWDLPIHKDTVYVSVVDRDLNALSIINSLFAAFGSGIYAPRHGVLLQNRGCGFSLKPGHPNAIGGGKRPFHTIIPALLQEKGETVMSFGVMGGQFQAVGHAHILSEMFDRGRDVQAANAAPRSFAFSDNLQLETTHSPATFDRLTAMGHRVCWADEPIGGSQAVWIDRKKGVLLGASDHRKDGIALGY